jgi:hypothetical protein
MATNSTDSSPPAETRNEPSMNWVMVIWVISFLLVVIFGVATYLLGWIFHRKS